MIKKLTAIGCVAYDSDETCLQKQFLIYSGSLMSVGGLMWGGIAAYFELAWQSTIPFGYALVTIINFAIFAQAKNFASARFVQVLLSLLLPFLFQWSLGGFAQTGAMMLWALVALVGSITYQEIRLAVRWLVIYVALVLFSGFIDSYVNVFAIKISPTVQTAFFVTNMTMISCIVAGLVIYFVHSRNESHRNLTAFKENLEHLVEARTAELQETLNQAESLKMQQDGDYYLTSLLTKPLNGNFSNSKNILIDLLIRQKKNFVFRERALDIGGDLCAAYNISLKNHDYVLFVNADAMGKSQQGAAGSLIMGSVLKAAVSRTQRNSFEQEKYPELWLKECFLELQHVFEAFDGSMMVSAVLGLMSETNGFIYYINAEHPNSVLYRNGQAEFIENKQALRKIGIPDLNSKVQISVFQMEPGDVLMLGSDGKDDVLLNRDGEMNYDEYQFLKYVEAANGDLLTIEKNILESSTITDDLSLLKLTYQPIRERGLSEIIHDDVRHILQKATIERKSRRFDQAVTLFEEARMRGDKSVLLYRSLTWCYFKLRLWENAADICEAYHHINPADTRFMAFASFVFKKNHQMEKAAAFGERCRLRDPAYHANLLNLSDIYRLMNQTALAKAMANEALNAKPECKRTQRFSEKLSQVVT